MKKILFIIVSLCFTFFVQSFGILAQSSQDTAPEGFVFIQGGTFIMGSPALADLGAQPAHQVTITQGFYMGVHLVTQGLWESVMGTNPSTGNRGVNFPVTDVTWIDAVQFANELSLMKGLTPAYSISGSGWSLEVSWDRNANGYRLPTEAEWEFAARAGTTTPWNTGTSITTTQANFNRAYGGTTEVGRFPPNAWGLYDLPPAETSSMPLWVWLAIAGGAVAVRRTCIGIKAEKGIDKVPFQRIFHQNT